MVMVNSVMKEHLVLNIDSVHRVTPVEAIQVDSLETFSSMMSMDLSMSMMMLLLLLPY
jgi:hypothetical protein